MAFNFGSLWGRGWQVRSAGVHAGDFVVARQVDSAPSAWVFFDGTETLQRTSAGTVVLPGGAFFIDEARAYGEFRQAQAQAARLNAASPSAASEWVAVAVNGVMAGLSNFTPQICPPRAKARSGTA